MRDPILRPRSIFTTLRASEIAHHSRPLMVAIGLTTIALPGLTKAQSDIPPDQLQFFEDHIRPALEKYCYECHSREENTSRAGLLVDTREDLLLGGDSGPAVVPGDLEGSVLWEAINWQHGLEMPEDEPMPDPVIAHFEEWILMGAPDPREVIVSDFESTITQSDIEKAKEHWAFQPPTVERGATIDGIVNKKLQESGLKPNAPADPYTILRRLNFDLIGLPPMAEEIEAFQAAWARGSKAAIKSKAEELLMRPQYGERWGRHWMDVARYAESSGSRSASFPYAWRYRDYVIDSFNQDTPYDQFIREQIAGDLLPVQSDEEWQKNLIATGFLAIGLKHLDQKDPRIFMSDMVDEQIDTMTQAVLGLTVSCARCHDHKYDAIPTQDYYAMAGIFHSTNTLYGTERVAQIHRASDLLLLPILDERIVERGGNQDMDQLKRDLEAARQRMAEVGNRRDAAMNGNSNAAANQARNAVRRLEAEIAGLNPDGSRKTYGMGVQDADEMVNAHILLGGEIQRPAQQVERGFLQVLGDLNFEVDEDKSGRMQLAESMSSKANPLTARVMVNRIWMHLLGKPLVATPNNFGTQGLRPENQELLDYLAVRFMYRGWSVRRLIHEIVQTDTYQRSSQYHEQNYGVDPENELFWRANPRHLDAEALRDSMLAVSGRIDLERPLGSQIGERGEGRPAGPIDDAVTYRSVYLPIVRDQLVDSLKIFDFPDPNQTSASRQQSVVPAQALYMMNSNFVTSQAKDMASKLESESSSLSRQIESAFLQAYGRPATDQELAASELFFENFSFDGRPSTPALESAAAGGKGKGKGKSGKGGKGTRGISTGVSNPDNEALAIFCQTLMASARFRILN
ncbi:MAG: PSD1 and planctomycete cytochrome C domain-containing protein [Verrucomicrobiota bacterium]